VRRLIARANLLLPLVPILLCGFFALFVEADSSFRIAAAVIAALFAAALLAAWRGVGSGYLIAAWGVWIAIAAMLSTFFIGSHEEGRGEWGVLAICITFLLVGILGVLVSTRSSSKP